MTGAPTSTGTLPPPPPPPPPVYPPQYVIAPPPRRSWLRRIGVALLVMFLISSLLLNFGLLHLSGLAERGGLERVTIRQGERDQEIAVYEIGGVIDNEQAALFHAFAKQVAANNNVKAVVLRVESPGGSVSASDQIHHDIQRLQDKGRRKVVVSMGGVAASGGYYIAAPADEIWAEETTITGSIGVIAMVPILTGTLEKIGVEMVTIKSTQADKWKDALSAFKRPTEEEIAYVRGILDQMHARFAKDVVLDGRKKAGMAESDLPDIANGQVWMGREALTRRLVDKLGYFDDAVNGAATLASLGKPHVVRYRRQPGLLETLLAESPGLKIDSKLLDEAQTPKFMMLWRAE